MLVRSKVLTVTEKKKTSQEEKTALNQQHPKS